MFQSLNLFIFDLGISLVNFPWEEQVLVPWQHLIHVDTGQRILRPDPKLVPGREKVIPLIHCLRSDHKGEFCLQFITWQHCFYDA